MQERKALHTLLAKRQEDLPPRRMKDSYLEVLLPLGCTQQRKVTKQVYYTYNKVLTLMYHGFIYLIVKKTYLTGLEEYLKILTV